MYLTTYADCEVIRVVFLLVNSYSDMDVNENGIYRYCESQMYTLCRIVYAIGDSEAVIVDLRTEKIPDELLNTLRDKRILKRTINAEQTRTLISYHLKETLNPVNWCDINVAERYWGQGFKAASRGNFELKSLPVTVEECEALRIHVKDMPDRIWNEYFLDQRINGRGVQVDLDFVNAAIEVIALMKEAKSARLKELTGIHNPSTIQVKHFLEAKGIEGQSLSRPNAERLMEEIVDEELKELLRLHIDLSMTSIKKYEQILKVVCRDGRVRSLLTFWGASTGRWTSHSVQIHNLPRIELANIGMARQLVMERDYEGLELMYGSCADVLSQLIRTAFIAKAGCKLVVCDYISVEARVLAWLVNEEWRMKAYSERKDIYVKTAEELFGVRVEYPDGPNAELRKLGKVIELALSYGGSRRALERIDELKKRFSGAQFDELVRKWRLLNPRIVEAWEEYQRAAIMAVENKCSVSSGKVMFCMNVERDALMVELPSGRSLIYPSPGIEVNQHGKKVLIYMKDDRSETSYGAKLLENIVQAISRDILANALMHLECCGFRVVMHVHDEVVLEVDEAASRYKVKDIMEKSPQWAPEIPLAVSCFEDKYYRKG